MRAAATLAVCAVVVACTTLPPARAACAGEAPASLPVRALSSSVPPGARLVLTPDEARRGFQFTEHGHKVEHVGTDLLASGACAQWTGLLTFAVGISSTGPGPIGGPGVTVAKVGIGVGVAGVVAAIAGLVVWPIGRRDVASGEDARGTAMNPSGDTSIAHDLAQEDSIDNRESLGGTFFFLAGIDMAGTLPMMFLGGSHSATGVFWTMTGTGLCAELIGYAILSSARADEQAFVVSAGPTGSLSPADSDRLPRLRRLSTTPRTARSMPNGYSLSTTSRNPARLYTTSTRSQCGA